MKKMFRILALSAFLLGIALPTMAQEKNYYEYPHFYIGVQGGIQTTRPEFKLSDLKHPIGALSFGATFNKYVGMRINAAGIWDKGLGYVGETPFNYDSNYLTTDIDFLLNVTNLFRSGDKHFLNLLLLAGVGATTEWGADKDNATIYEENAMARQMYDLVSNARLGAQINLDLGKHLDFNIEGGVNRMNFPHGYNVDGRDKYEAYLMAGLAFKFGHNKRQVKQAPVQPAPVVQPQPKPQPQPVVKPEPKPEPKPVVKPEPKPVVKQEPVAERKVEAPKPVEKKFNIFFNKAKAAVQSEYDNTIADVVKFVNQNPTTKVQLTGYADKGTGNPTINKTLADQRVNMVKDELIKAGVPASRISTDSKGDTEQPFAENDKNRVVIGIVK